MLSVLIAFGVALASAIALAVIGWRKVPTLLMLDPGKLPKAETERKKRKILEARVDRRLKQVEQIAVRAAEPVRRLARQGYQNLLDRMHRTAVRTANPPSAPTLESAVTVAELLDRAAREEQAGRFEELEATAVSVLRIDPTNLAAYRHLAASAVARARFDEADEVYRYLDRRGVADAAVYDAMGFAAVQRRRRNEAERAYARAVDLAPDHPEHRLHLAEARLTLGDPTGAFEAASEALRTAPANPKVLDAYIAVALEANKPGFAEDGLAKLEAANPENAKIPEYRARIKEELDALPKRRRR